MVSLQWGVLTRHKGSLLLVAGLSFAMLLMLYNSPQPSQAYVWSLITSFPLEMIPAPTELMPPKVAPEAQNTKLPRDAWSDVSAPVSSDILARRFAWVSATHSYFTLEQYNSYAPMKHICLKPDKVTDSLQPRCFDSVLITAPHSAPICMLNHIYIHTSYIHDGQVISLADMSLTLWQNRPAVFWCPSGVQPKMYQTIVSEWIVRRFPSITHTSAWIRCPAAPPENAKGVILANYNGDCSVTKESITTAFMNTVEANRTYMMLIPTPISQSFQQAWPNVPLRGNAFLPNGATAKPHLPYQYSTCAMAGVIDTEAPFLTAWLWHMRNKVQVEHVVMYIAPESFHLDSPHIDAQLLKSYLEDGFLTLVPWASRFVNLKQIYYRSQQLAYSDYAFRFRGLCHWTLFADVDDFFVNWRDDHQLVPFISRTLNSSSSADVIRLYWPVFFPQCQGISGHGPPFDSDFLLSNITYGAISIDHSPTKQIVATRNKQEIHIHTTAGAQSFPNELGVAMYHIRAGPHAGLKLANFSKEECDPYILKDFDLEKRKTHRMA